MNATEDDAGDGPEQSAALAGQAAAAPAAPVKNAFQALMSPKPKPQHRTKQSRASKPFYRGREALGEYIESPESFSADWVIQCDDDFVLIRDMFPKSEVHLLLLPRDMSKTMLHPFEAFADTKFRDSILERVEGARKLVASELRRLHGLTSAAEQPRNEAMERGDDKLPEGRNWLAEVVSGVHAVPSMSHLHVHILSVDRHSPALKHRKHYNSFATPFLVPVEDMPLAHDDPRRHPTREGYLAQDLVCWRCGRNVGNSFTRLKEHLSQEYEAWRAL